MRNVIIILSLFFSLQGCALMQPAKLDKTNRYTINPGRLSIATANPTSLSLLVMSTEANQDISNNGMMYVTKPYELTKFVYNRWAAHPAQMLTPLIAKALQQSGHFRAVVVSPFSGEVDLRLNTHLYTLQQNFLTKPSRVQMRLSAQIVNADSGKIIAEKTFNEVVPAPQDNPYGGVVATNKATKLILQKLVRFCVGIRMG